MRYITECVDTDRHYKLNPTSTCRIYADLGKTSVGSVRLTSYDLQDLSLGDILKRILLKEFNNEGGGNKSHFGHRDKEKDFYGLIVNVSSNLVLLMNYFKLKILID